MAEWSSDLGLAYAFTGNEKYARRAIDIIYAWCVDPDTYMRPISWDFGPHTPGFRSSNVIAVFIAIRQMAWGAAFVSGHPYWQQKGSGAENKVRQWFGDMLDSANERGWKSENYKSEWIETRTALAAYLGDEAELKSAFQTWKSHVSVLIKGNGFLHREARRTRGMHYTYNAIRVLTRVAEVADYYGVDLYGYDDGAGSGSMKGVPVLKRAYLYNAKYVLDNKMPSRWEADGRQEVGPLDTEQWRAIYEWAYSKWRDPVFKDVIDRSGRPLHGSRQFPITLLFGDAFKLSAPSGSDGSSGGYTDGGSDGGYDGGSDGGYDGGYEDPSSGGSNEPSGGGAAAPADPGGDAHVQDGAYAHDNFGSDDVLMVKHGKASGYTREAYLQFDLSGYTSPIESAVIRLHPVDVGDAGQQHVMLVTGNGWSESTLTWNTRPSSGTELARWTVQAGSSVEVDVTQAARTSGGILSVRVRRTGGSGAGNYVKYASAQYGDASKRPELVVTTDDFIAEGPDDGSSSPADDAETPVESNDDAETPVESNDAPTTPVESNDATETPVESNDDTETPVESDDAATTPVESNDAATTPEDSGGDAHVQDGAYAHDNFGSDDVLMVKHGKASGYTREAYLQFDLSGYSSPVESAVIRLHPVDVGDAGQQHAMLVAGNGWSESTLTWNTRPSSGTELARWKVKSGGVVAVDVTQAAEAARTSGGILSVRVRRTGGSGAGNYVKYASAQYGDASKRPELVVSGATEPVADVSPDADAGIGTATASLGAGADSWVRAGAYSKDGYGSSDILYVKHGKDNDFTREAYLQFDFSNVDGVVTSATLRLHVLEAGTSGVVNELVLVDDDGWSESGLTWNTRPGSSGVLGRWTAEAGEVVELDISDAAEAARTGDGRLSLRIHRPKAGGSDYWVKYGSREHADEDKRPSLKLTVNTATLAKGGAESFGSERPEEIPTSVRLDQNYPNPFNPETNIVYHLSETSSVTLRIFDVSGRLVRVLVDEAQASGRHEVRWDGRSAGGVSLSSGTYIYQLVTGTTQISRTMLLMK